MLGNILFIVIIFGCLITITILLIIQNSEKKKKRALAQLSEEDYEEDIEPQVGFEIPDVLFTAMPSGMAYKKTLRSFHMSLHKLRTDYDLSEEGISKMSEAEQEKLFNLLRKNIYAFKRIREIEKEKEVTCVEDVLSYKYLSYIYELRDNYQYAMYACATALKLNACSPEGKKYMIDRINYLSDKSELEIPDNIKELLDEAN